MGNIDNAETGEHEGIYISLDALGAMAGSYAVISDGVILIPAIFTKSVRMKDIINRLVHNTKLKRVIFTSANSAELKSKLKNIVREWDESVELKDVSHCIEIEWICGKVNKLEGTNTPLISDPANEVK